MGGFGGVRRGLAGFGVVWGGFGWFWGRGFGEGFWGVGGGVGVGFASIGAALKCLPAICFHHSDATEASNSGAYD